MQERYIPFQRSVEHVAQTMLGIDVRARDAERIDPKERRFQVSSVIGLSGDVTGVVVLGMDREVAERLIGRLMGEAITIEHDDFMDAFGELSNMIAGNAKARLNGYEASISCPSVVVNDGHQLFRPRTTPTFAIACQCEDGEFFVEVTMQVAVETEEASPAGADARPVAAT